jgi:uracil-DNA glycosylase family protein
MMEYGMREVAIAPTLESWQRAARQLVARGVPPTEIAWIEVDSPAAVEVETAPTRTGEAQASIRVPRRFLELARHVAAHRDPERWQLLYQLLWRLTHEDRGALDRPGDPLVGRLGRLEEESRHQTSADVAETAAGSVAAAGTAGPVGAPPRRRVGKRSGTPVIAPGDDYPGAARFIPAGAGLPELVAAAARCTGCPLYRSATQTVFGRGPVDARIVLVGEQPGDQEDRQGAPFVGPAGEVLDRALAEVGLDRLRLYVTNAVKHFKFVERGKRRIHDTPRTPEVTACRPWVEAEIALIRPEIVVCLGATAARALLGNDFRIMKERGRFLATRWAPRTIATLHPSAILRGQDEAEQTQLFSLLVADLRLVAAA